jgi:hypothetical protein
MLLQNRKSSPAEVCIEPTSLWDTGRGADLKADPRHGLLGGAGQASMTLQTVCWYETSGFSSVPVEVSIAIPSGSASIASVNLP